MPKDSLGKCPIISFFQLNAQKESASPLRPCSRTGPSASAQGVHRDFWRFITGLSSAALMLRKRCLGRLGSTGSICARFSAPTLRGRSCFSPPWYKPGCPGPAVRWAPLINQCAATRPKSSTAEGKVLAGDQPLSIGTPNFVPWALARRRGGAAGRRSPILCHSPPRFINLLTASCSKNITLRYRSRLLKRASKRTLKGAATSYKTGHYDWVGAGFSLRN